MLKLLHREDGSNLANFSRSNVLNVKSEVRKIGGGATKTICTGKFVRRLLEQLA